MRISTRFTSKDISAMRISPRFTSIDTSIVRSHTRITMKITVPFFTSKSQILIFTSKIRHLLDKDTKTIFRSLTSIFLLLVSLNLAVFSTKTVI